MINSESITSIESLVNITRQDSADWGTDVPIWFRGEPKVQEPLLPKLYRTRIGKSPYKENRLLQQFRSRAPSLGLMNTPPRNQTDDWLFFSQHMGLPTRLLDWTEGLFIAIYFALLESNPVIWMLNPLELNKIAFRDMNQGELSKEIESTFDLPLTLVNPEERNSTQLYLLRIGKIIIDAIDQLNKRQGDNHQQIESDLFGREKMIKEMYDPDLFRLQANIGNLNIRGAWENNIVGTNIPVAVYPTYIHPRMSSQKSCFTIHGLKHSCLSELVSSSILKKYTISVNSVAQMREDLHIMGISRTSIFPDLDNLAKELSERN
ncbi:MAG: FRG domain-containing protein [Anaerolineales bacterium]|jgi:hypothetical protein